MRPPRRTGRWRTKRRQLPLRPGRVRRPDRRGGYGWPRSPPQYRPKATQRSPSRSKARSSKERRPTPEQERTGIAPQTVGWRPASAPVPAGVSALRHAAAEESWTAGPRRASGEEAAQARPAPEAAGARAAEAAAAPRAAGAVRRPAVEVSPAGEAGIVVPRAAEAVRRPAAEAFAAGEAEVAPQAPEESRAWEAEVALLAAAGRGP